MKTQWKNKTAWSFHARLDYFELLDDGIICSNWAELKPRDKDEHSRPTANKRCRMWTRIRTCTNSKNFNTDNHELLLSSSYKLVADYDIFDVCCCY